MKTGRGTYNSIKMTFQGEKVKIVMFKKTVVIN